MSIDNDKLVVAALRNMALKYDDVIAFIDDIILDGVREEPDDADKLVISTIHSAKGLEWKVVIVLDCIEKVFPRVKQEEWFTEDDEEELRCFYVAITRAKRYLIMFAPEFVNTYLGVDEAQLSHYLNGVPGYVVKKIK